MQHAALVERMVVVEVALPLVLGLWWSHPEREVKAYLEKKHQLLGGLTFSLDAICLENDPGCRGEEFQEQGTLSWTTTLAHQSHTSA